MRLRFTFHFEIGYFVLFFEEKEVPLEVYFYILGNVATIFTKLDPKT